MAKKKQFDADFSKIAKRIIKTPLQDFVEESFLPFAHYSIMQRALISDDGLKPVQRRILHAMLQLGLTPEKPYLKAATIVGEVMGKYHPHGDSSISDALARLGQDFSLRVPLVDVYGSVGHTTGDVPAAPRYWEGRPTKAAIEAVREIKEGAIDLSINYDGTLPEPTILPTRWPIGIINGSEGIAVGYSSKIMPHNPTEVMDACVYLVKNPEASLKEIMKIMKGPDMPTGGILLGKEGVKDYFETGKGTFIIRGKYKIEPGARGTHVITFSEAPYQISSETITGDISKCKRDKNLLKEVSFYKDLSDKKNGFKYSIGVKGGANPEVVLRDLFKHTSLQASFPVNSTVLIDGVPKVVPMLDLLKNFIAFRCMCITNKANYKIKALNKSIERLEGILKVLVDIDKAIKIIRGAEDSTIANEQLQKTFKINEEQSNYILSMPLRKLTKSDSIEIQTDLDSKKAEKEKMERVLNDEEVFKQYLVEELEETKKIIASPRRTALTSKTSEDLKAEAAEIRKVATKSNKNVDCYITLTADGNVIRAEEPFVQSKKQVAIISQVKAKSQENLIFINKNGEATRIPTSFVPEVFVDVQTLTGINVDSIAGLAAENVDKDNFGVLIVTTSGGVNIVNGGYPVSKDFLITKLSDDENIVTAIPLTPKEVENKNLVLISTDGYVLKFPLEQVRTSNSGAGTVKGMNLNESAKIAGAAVSEPEKGVIVSCSHKTIKTTDLSDIPGRNRNAKGVILHKLVKEDEILTAFAGEAVVAIKAGKPIKIPEVNGRALAGVNRVGSGILLGHLTTK